MRGDQIMTRTFFSKKRADEFAKTLKEFDSVEIWMDTDAFNQKIYIVKWY